MLTNIIFVDNLIVKFLSKKIIHIDSSQLKTIKII